MLDGFKTIQEESLLMTHDAIQTAGLVDLDASYVVMLALFMALFFILNNRFLKPLLDMFDKRHALTVGSRQAAAASVEKAEARIAEYEAKVGAARRKAIGQAKDLRAEGMRNEKVILDGARDDANTEIDKGVAELNASADANKLALDQTANELGLQIAGRILGGA